MTALFLPPGAGTEHLFLGTTMTVKAGGDDTGGSVTLIEAAPPASPLRCTCTSTTTRGSTYSAGRSRCTARTGCGRPGWGLHPAAAEQPHAFVNRGAEPLRLLQLTWPAGFEHFAADVAALPPGPPDPHALAELGAQHGYEILGPPPS